MTKSRTALATLFGLAAASPAAALADPPVTTAEEALAAYDARFQEMMADARAARRCRRGGDEGDIVVCGRSEDARMRVPYEPEPGARTRLIAGEAPSGVGALGAGDACCGGGGLNVIAIVRGIATGVDRILHPD